MKMPILPIVKKTIWKLIKQNKLTVEFKVGNLPTLVELFDEKPSEN